MVDTVIKLINPLEQYQDDYGIWRDRGPSEREIFARLSSIDRREFFSAGEAGFKPEYKFTVFMAEYHGEALCEFEGQTYAIYRSYHVPGTDDLELYVQQKVGVSNGE